MAPRTSSPAWTAFTARLDVDRTVLEHRSPEVEEVRATRPRRKDHEQHLSEQRLEELWRLHGTALLNFALKLTLGDHQRAEDIVQETFARAWQSIDKIFMDYGAGRPWLFTVARRIAIDGIRGRSCRPRETDGESLDQLPARDDWQERVIDRLDVKDALALLKPEQRRVLIEIYLRERPLEEAATALGIPVGTVKSRAFYALRALRDALCDASGDRTGHPRGRSAAGEADADRHPRMVRR